MSVYLSSFGLGALCIVIFICLLFTVHGVVRLKEKLMHLENVTAEIDRRIDESMNGLSQEIISENEVTRRELEELDRDVDSKNDTLHRELDSRLDKLESRLKSELSKS